MPSYTVQMGRNRPACLGLAQPLRLVAQHDGNRGQRSATTALAAVGDSGQPAPEVGGEQVLWQGGGVVDYFEAKKEIGGGLTGAVHGGACSGRGTDDGSTDRGSRGHATGSGSYAVLHRSSGTGQLGVQRGRDGVASWLHIGGTEVQWGRRAEEGERVLHGGRAPIIAGRGGGRRAAWR
jgi:hypothetical protein